MTEIDSNVASYWAWDATQNESRTQMNKATRVMSESEYTYYEHKFVGMSRKEIKGIKRERSRAQRRIDHLLEATYGY